MIIVIVPVPVPVAADAAATVVCNRFMQSCFQQGQQKPVAYSDK